MISITNATTTNWTATAAAHTIIMMIVWCLKGRHRKSILYVVVYHFIVMVPAKNPKKRYIQINITKENRAKVSGKKRKRKKIKCERKLDTHIKI